MKAAKAAKPTKAAKAGKMDPTTFVYGVGAAIVLTGAMFKFLGWPYANELFVFGLSVEVIIFLISAFERQTDDKEYQWENVFPQLQTREEDPGTGVVPHEGYGQALTQFSNTLSQLTSQMQEMTQSIGQIKTEMDDNVRTSAQMKKQMEEFNQQMDTYNSHMSSINEKYKSILSK